ncbi:lipoprotein [Candidatus Magnetomorum sp. HK-1]|nr:lipoprotein [Candidatus Magnetomorum sp. HK-1]
MYHMKTKNNMSNNYLWINRLLIICLILVITGCGKGDKNSDNNSNNQNFVNLTGKVSFEEYIPTDDGLSDEVYSKPVRYAEFEIISEDGSIIDNGNLNEDGVYSVELNRNQNVYLKINSDTRFSGSANVYIVDSNNQIYSYMSPPINPNQINNFNMTIPIDNHGKISGGFNILDVASTCSDIMIKATGITHPELRLTWELGNLNQMALNELVINCFYQHGKEPHTIFLVGGQQESDGTIDLTSETAHFDDMVIAHEIGHFVQHVYSVDASQGGGHNGNSLYPSLSFSEGFATWFAAVCLNNPNYIATVGLPPEQQLNFSNYNIENVDNISYRNYGIQSEFTVAEVLWDIYDGSEDFLHDSDNDGINVKFSNIINIFQKMDKNNDYPFLITILDDLINEEILTEFEITGLLSYPTDQKIEYPYLIKWPFPMEFGVAYPTNGQPYYIGIPVTGTIESEPYLFSGSFFLNQFWTFVVEELTSEIVVTFGVEPEEVPQIISLEIYTNDNIFITRQTCTSGNYIQVKETLQKGKYIIKIIGYVNDNEQYGKYWITVENNN